MTHQLTSLSTPEINKVSRVELKEVYYAETSQLTPLQYDNAGLQLKVDGPIPTEANLQL